MKKYVFILLVMFTTLTMSQVCAQKHRHSHQQTELVDSVNKGVTLYSDTTSAVADSTANAAFDSQFDEDDDNNFSIGEETLSDGAIVSIVGFSLLFAFLIIFAPIIFIAIILFFIYKHNKQKNATMQEAIHKGVAMPQQQSTTRVITDTPTMQKGIKLISVGIGLVVLFYCLGAEALCGIGWLVAIIGAGKFAIAYFSGEKIKDINKPARQEVVEEEDPHATYQSTTASNATTEPAPEAEPTTDNYDKSE